MASGSEYKRKEIFSMSEFFKAGERQVKGIPLNLQFFEAGEAFKPENITATIEKLKEFDELEEYQVYSGEVMDLMIENNQLKEEIKKLKRERDLWQQVAYIFYEHSKDETKRN